MSENTVPIFAKTCTVSVFPTPSRSVRSQERLLSFRKLPRPDWKGLLVTSWKSGGTLQRTCREKWAACTINHYVHTIPFFSLCYNTTTWGLPLWLVISDQTRKYIHKMHNLNLEFLPRLPPDVIMTTHLDDLKEEKTKVETICNYDRMELPWLGAIFLWIPVEKAGKGSCLHALAVSFPKASGWWPESWTFCLI